MAVPKCGCCHKRPTRIPDLPCGPCRKRLSRRRSSTTVSCPFTKRCGDVSIAATGPGPGRRNGLVAIVATLLACCSTSAASQGWVLNAASVFLDEEADIATLAGVDEKEPNHLKFGPARNVKERSTDVRKGGDEKVKRDTNHDDCPPRGKRLAWIRIVGATVLINIIVPIVLPKSKMVCFTGRSSIFLSFGTASLLLVTTVSKVFPRAFTLISHGAPPNDDDDDGLILNSANTPSRAIMQVGLLAFSGFVLPIIFSLTYCHNFDSQHANDDSGDKSNDEADLSTVGDEEDCLSCETCKKGWGYPDTSLPSCITIKKQRGDYSTQEVEGEGIYLNQGDTLFVSGFGGSSSQVMASHFCLFFHGIFISAAAIASCSWDGTLVVVSIIALIHSIYLERQVNADTFSSEANNENWLLKGRLFRSFIGLGGVSTAVLVEVVATPDAFVAGAMFAMAGGFYAYIALSMVFTPSPARSVYTSHRTSHEKHYQSDQIGKFSGNHRKRSRRDINQFYQTRGLLENDNEYCMPCAPDIDNGMPSQRQRLFPSKSHAIPLPKFTSQAAANSTAQKVNDLAKKYNYATWNMYARITSAREARRAKCGICMGSMDEDDEPGLVAVVGKVTEKKASVMREKEQQDKLIISKSEEELETLIRTCPSPLYYDSVTESGANDRKGATMTEKCVLNVHQKCFYGAVVGEGASSHSNIMALLEENMVFQLEL